MSTTLERKEFILPQIGSKEFEEMFPIVDIESVSLEDTFLQYEPKDDNDSRVKMSIIEAKKNGMKNFRKPAMDPSFADDEETIIYCAGLKPAIGKTAYWWFENSPKFMSEKNSRMMTETERDVFLGILIKELVKEGETVEEAWKTVCVDSREIAHYYEFYVDNPKLDYEMTGSRPVGKWFDLGNTSKIVRKKDSDYPEFICAGGLHFDDHLNSSLAKAHERPGEYKLVWVGEIVMDV